MRVIAEKENNPNLPTMQVSCTGQGFEEKGCGRLLEVTGLDISKGSYRDYSGSIDVYYYITCPICHKRTEVFYSSQYSSVFSLAGKK